MHPAAAAPLFKATTAADDNDPKLIAETLTNDSGRNAFARPRGPPRIFADGTVSPSPLCGAPDGAIRENVRCLMIVYPSVNSMSLSVPKPKVSFSLFDTAYTQCRWSRVNGRSSSLRVTMY